MSNRYNNETDTLKVYDGQDLINKVIIGMILTAIVVSSYLSGTVI